MKFCVDCEYYDGYMHVCFAPNNLTISKVTGAEVFKTEVTNYYCNILRDDKNSCGPEAKWFKEKPIEEKTEIVPWYKKLFKEN
ncbi:MAG: hypothetical protein PVF17_00105 [Ignavibacteria bacterium]|jgi:hypothetical protein